MRIFIFLFLLTSCLIYCGNAAGNTNQINIASVNDPFLGDATVRKRKSANRDGGETVQDHNDSKYKKMAEELVRNNLRVKDEDIKNIKVNRVTTQVVKGTITRIEIQITLVSGISDQCNFQVWNKPWANEKDVTYKCHKLNQNKVLNGISATTRPEQSRDPKDPKYQKLAKASIDYLFKTPERKPFKKEDISKVYVTKVKVQISSKITIHMQFDVITVNNDNYQCTGTIFEKPWNPDETATISFVNCSLNKVNKLSLGASPSKVNQIVPGGVVEQYPYDPIYKQLAKESFDKFTETHNLSDRIEELTMNKVTTQLVAGSMTRINFDVITANGRSFSCRSKIFEQAWKHFKDISVTCQKSFIPGGEVDKNPDDPKYKQLAKESFQMYMNSHSKVNVQAKSIKIDRVTSQLVAGTIIRIHFHVFPTRGNILQCQTKIFEKLGPERDLDFDVSCNSDSDGEVEQNPNDPQYEQLAKESFRWYQKSHRDVNIQVESIKIDSVTTQVVAGTITRIHFQVHPTRGSTYLCQSQIFEGVGSESNVNFVVSCSRLIGGEVVEDSDDPKYQPLAKQSFEWYLNFNRKDNVQVKSIKIDLVTSQVVAGKIIRIHFHVYPTRGSTFICQSQIFEGVGWEPNLDFVVRCNHLNGGEEERDPDDPKYQQLGKESFSKYHETHVGQYTVKELKVTRATTQVVAGVITQLDFDVITTNGGKFICHSKILEQPWIDIKKIDVNCLNTGGVMRLSAKQSGVMRLTANQSGKLKADFVSEAVKEYLQNINKGIYFDRSETKSVRTATTRVAKQKITYYEVEAVRHTVRGDYTNFHCSVLTGSWFGKKPFATNCIKNKFLMGRGEWMDPTNKKYLSFAEKSLQLHLKNASIDFGPRDYTKYDIIVTFVTQGVVAGGLDNIDFLARWVHGTDDDPRVLMCHTKIWEKLNRKNLIQDVYCNALSWDRN